jgi:hypothetical protein
VVVSLTTLHSLSPSPAYSRSQFTPPPPHTRSLDPSTVGPFRVLTDGKKRGRNARGGRYQHHLRRRRQEQQQRQWQVRDRVTIAIYILYILGIYRLSSITGEQFGAQFGPLRPPSPSGPTLHGLATIEGGVECAGAWLTCAHVGYVEVTRVLTKP